MNEVDEVRRAALTLAFQHVSLSEHAAMITADEVVAKAAVFEAYLLGGAPK